MRELRVSIWSARRNLRRLMALTAEARDVLITSHGKPVAHIAAHEAAARARKASPASGPIFARIGASGSLLRVVP